MSLNTFGHMFRFTTWGESHGPAIGATVDGCPSGIALTEADLQPWLDKRKPGTSKFTTQRKEADEVRILSGVFEGRTTGTPIQLMIENTDQRSKDYGDIAQAFRPGHADITYHQKYGVRDYRGGGRSSARETASRVAAGGVARAVLAHLVPALTITGYMVQMGPRQIDRSRFDWAQIEENPFWCPDPVAAKDWAEYLDALRLSHDSVGAVIEVVARACKRISISVNKNVYFLPIKSPNLPKINPPKGLATNPAPKAANVEMNAAVGSSFGKKLNEIIALKLPKI
eukprot:gene38193-50087_t